jgi:hypothetical protein
MLKRTLRVILVCLLLGSGAAIAELPKGICEKVFEPVGNEKLLSCKYVGGDRSTREIGGEKYIYDVGTCWDVDIVSVQKCGCRLFSKSSVCCRKGKSNKGDCELRVGNSKLVDCKPFNQPAFGLAGDTEPENCKKQRMATDCWGRNDLSFGPGVVTGPCMESPKFKCSKGDEDMARFLNAQCGPTPENCGCKLVEACSDPKALQCYQEWVTNPKAISCYDPKLYDNGYKRNQCMEALKKK